MDSLKQAPDPRPHFPQRVERPIPSASVKQGRGVMTDIGGNAITLRADQIRHNTDEEMIWTETPSLVLMVAPLLRWGLLFALAITVAHLGHQQLPLSASASPTAAVSALTKHARSKAERAIQTHAAEAAELEAVVGWSPAFVAAGAALRLLVLFLRIKTTHYSASSQRLVVESGIFLTINHPYELHTLSNALIIKPFLLRLFGVSNLLIGQPRIALMGLRNAAYVRDILRTSGQLEGQRFDKVRWR